MAPKNTDFWEGVEQFEINEEAEWLFVPAGIPRLRGRWRSYVHENSFSIWRYWWEHWWLFRTECCCCCCCEEARSTSSSSGVPTAARSNLSIDFHVVKLFTILIGGQGRLPYEIHLGWTISGATGQVQVTLEYGGASRQYRNVASFQGSSVADYMVQPAGGGFIYGPQTVWFRLSASDSTGATASQELPVNLP